jgi:hypothetical protein
VWVVGVPCSVNHPRPRPLPDTEQAAPGLFLEEVFHQLRELLARPDQEPRYTRTVLLAAGWAELEVLVAWLRLTGFLAVFSTYFHSLGVVAGCEGGVGPANSCLTGWPAAGAGLVLQEEALALHSVAMARLQAGGQGHAIQKLLDTDCLATAGRPARCKAPCVRSPSAGSKWPAAAPSSPSSGPRSSPSRPGTSPCRGSRRWAPL